MTSPVNGSESPVEAPTPRSVPTVPGKVWQFVRRSWKALTAAVAAGSSAYAVAVQDGSISQADWVTIIGSVVVAGVLTWLVPYRPQ